LKNTYQLNEELNNSTENRLYLKFWKSIRPVAKTLFGSVTISVSLSCLENSTSYYFF